LPFQPNGLPKKDMGLEKSLGLSQDQQWRQETETSPKPESPTLLKNQDFIQASQPHWAEAD